MRIAYFDCFRGAGGDMIVAALLHAGADPAALESRLHKLGLQGYSIFAGPIKKQGFAAMRFAVQLAADAQQPHRHLKHILQILDRGELSDRVRHKAGRAFERLAEAEAKVHGTTVEKVHFHEVGAVDAILDVVGAMTALEMLGIEDVYCSAIPVGSGTVTCSHGVMPVPAPATVELLRGVPLAACDETGELTTPTAAAILTTLTQRFGAMPAMTVQAIGYGAGERDGDRRPNVLRVLVGEGGNPELAESDEIIVLECNIDDASAELIGHALERVLEAGALDAYAVPIQMKKSRPGVMLAVLCEPTKAAEFERILFAETTTFGVRRHAASRAKMRRRIEMVPTRFGPIRMKVGERGGIVTASPEFADCKAAAERHGAAVREVMALAQAAWHSSDGRGSPA